jgi:hypothetical protein
MQSLWFISPHTLSSAIALIAQSMQLPDFELDSENLYEWAESASTDDAWHINLSRKHRAGAPLVDVPFHVQLKGNPPSVPLMARRLAHALSCTVHWGEIEYLGADRYAYRSAGHATA